MHASHDTKVRYTSLLWVHDLVKNPIKENVQINDNFGISIAQLGYIVDISCPVCG